MGLFNGNQFPYTNFHEMNLDWIAERIEQAAGIADGLADRVTDAESAINTLDQRVTADDQLIAGNTSQIATHTSQIAELDQDISTLDQRVTTETATLDHRITTETNALDDRITSNSDAIDLLETRVSTAESDIDTLETDVADKSTVEVEQILSGGVRVGTITVDGTATTLFAPTAGSTVVRAEDVPFNNSDVVPAMTAVDCQEAIEELNTNNGAVDTRVTSLEGTVTSLSSDMASAETDIDNLETNVSNHSSQLSQMRRDILSLNNKVALNARVYYFTENVPVGDTEYVDEIGRVTVAGYMTGEGRNLVCTIPYNRIMPGYMVNPIDDYSKYTISIDSGLLTARGTNGYLTGINNIAIDHYGQTTFESISIRAEKSGYYIVFRLPAASALINENNKPANLYFNSLEIRVERTSA